MYKQTNLLLSYLGVKSKLGELQGYKVVKVISHKFDFIVMLGFKGFKTLFELIANLHRCLFLYFYIYAYTK